ncbi:phosphonate ABC transporter, permease protein PhnE [Pelagovum pacificum]|uniref:Phosphonate ABC transporter, permease protein PhnE n=1 Tax=Pelagovum pacificum TaxID=2588711 RepID=A0A5C5GET3_9RHOB|nr:phosphonate ABC transporter, permease protein PhnE [Pelagovum pacificum]QQA43849.1 phosphonate ABC transporter, permease protein PhnE [Pelagovum pacificum]TNY33020.1 phosphonate ABC transporter, permease protein PhnE [Pelagovum pacificum]
MTDTTAAFTTARAGLRRSQLWIFGVPALVLAYLVYVFFAFDTPRVLAEADGENGAILLADMVSYKVHVTRDNGSGDVEYAIEGERKGRYPAGESPGWVTPATAPAGETLIDLGDSHLVRLFGEGGLRYDVPGYGVIEAKASRSGGVEASYPDGPLPDWINASGNRVAITTDAGRVNITRARTEVMRYFPGWELFFFTLDSPYSGLSFGQLAAAAFGGEAGAIWSDFWNNDMWRHKEVVWAIFETILMAFIGTAGAALIALPTAFLAARNFAPLGIFRQATRRLYDFLRGVDGLIWTVILSRAYGPGPLTGALAIMFTDTGTFGKLFSEALENVDEKQIEGVRSTGAGPLARARYGVIPQIVPVLLSQVLYYLESNTRSATVIGAITGGGIGLLLTQAIITQKDWEEVTYYIILIVLMVFLMDALSGWLRRRLISGGGATD